MLPARWVLGLCLTACALLVAWAVLFVPPNMDEFVAFHRLACTAPLSQFNTFREGCDAHTLDLGFLRYQMSYGYIGITSSALYYPFWALWPAPGSFYLQGVILLLVFGYGMARALNLKATDALLPVCYFPIGYSMLHDTGPIRLGLLSLPALLLIARRLQETDRGVAKVGLGLVAAAVVLVCAEDKAYYLLMAPLVCILAGTIGVGQLPTRGTLREARVPLAVFVVVVGAGLAVLLSARTDDGLTYLGLLRAHSALVAGSALTQLQRIAYYTTMFPLYGDRVFAVYAVPFALKLASAVPVVGLAAWLWRARAVSPWVLAACGAAYLAGAAALLVTGSATSSHHYVFLHLPILVVLMRAAAHSAGARRTVFAFVIATTVMSIGLLSATPVQRDTSRERGRVFDYASRPDVATTHVVNFSSWGGYYHQDLYGPRTQLVTFVDPLTPEGGARLADVARSTSRDLLNICMGCTREAMLDAFHGASVQEVPLGAEHWRAFRVRFR
jgi:hypothetical protein